MNNNSENHSASNPVVHEFSLVVTAIKIVVLAIFLVPFVKYSLIPKQDNENTTSNLLQNEFVPQENVILQPNLTERESNGGERLKKVIIPQPACPKSDIILIFDEICNDIVFKYYFCSPEDIHDPKKHKIPRYHLRNKSNKDPKGRSMLCLIFGENTFWHS